MTANLPRREKTLPRSSRTLTLPGPLAPSSHLGITLQRHLLASALRYTLYHLGLPLPEKPPVRIEKLRLYLETKPLVALLEGTPGGEEIAAALVDPGGAGAAPRRTRVGTALVLHRFRLWRFRPPRPGVVSPAGGAPASEGSRSELFAAFRRELTFLAPALGSALLAETIASVERRSKRLKLAEEGESLEPSRSQWAQRFSAGRQIPFFGFGSPDLRDPSWAEEVGRAALAREGAHDSAGDVVPVHRYRGRYRLALRAGLDRLRPLYLALARKAEERGVLERADDAFFFPLDLAEDLTYKRRPDWLDGAVATNRAELVRLFDGPEPPDILNTDSPSVEPRQALWGVAPLLAMP